jgi:hypothetical protein
VANPALEPVEPQEPLGVSRPFDLPHGGVNIGVVTAKLVYTRENHARRV